jgi:hypothetical protein
MAPVVSEHSLKIYLPVFILFRITGIMHRKNNAFPGAAASGGSPKSPLQPDEKSAGFILHTQMKPCWQQISENMLQSCISDMPAAY